MKQMLLSCLVTLLSITATSQNLSNLYTYVNKTGGYFHTIDWEVLKKGSDEYKQENSLGVVHTANDRGTSPVYAYYNSGRDGHFYTINDEIEDGDWGYRLQGVAFYAYKKKVRGTIAIHRYFHQEKLTHFYSTRFAKQLNGYGYEGIAFYIFPDEETAKASINKKGAVTFLPPLVTKPEFEEVLVPESELQLVDIQEMVQEEMDSVTTTIDTVIIPEDVRSVMNWSGYQEFISVQDQKAITSFTRSLEIVNNDVVSIISANNQELFRLIFPAQNNIFPVPGIYYFTDGVTSIPCDGKPVTIKVGSEFISNAGGLLVVEHRNDLVWFILPYANITVTNPKTKETKKINFTFSVSTK